jgi:methyl-accepting chemotaxis protein
MTTTKELLMKAIGAHGAWKMRLKTAIACGTFDGSVADAAAEDHCEFGKWLMGEIKSSDSDNAKRVRQLHAKFHKAAAHIAELAISGRKLEAESAIADGSEFGVTSTELTAAMMEWKALL